MSNKSRRGPQIPPRPQLFNEQQRRTILDQVGGTTRVLNRQQCMEFSVGLAIQLQNLLNAKEQLPWITASIDKRSDGFSLHVQVVQPTSETDAVVVTDAQR